MKKRKKKKKKRTKEQGSLKRTLRKLRGRERARIKRKQVKERKRQEVEDGQMDRNNLKSFKPGDIEAWEVVS